MKIDEIWLKSILNFLYQSINYYRLKSITVKTRN